MAASNDVSKMSLLDAVFAFDPSNSASDGALSVVISRRGGGIGVPQLASTSLVATSSNPSVSSWGTYPPLPRRCRRSRRRRRDDEPSSSIAEGDGGRETERSPSPAVVVVVVVGGGGGGGASPALEFMIAQ